MKGLTAKEGSRLLLLSTVFVGVVLVTLFFLNQITGRRVVANATMPNGVEIKIEQTFTWSGDLFNTSFHYRRPGGAWVWRYYSHEDGYWGRGRVEIDESARVATVYRAGKPTLRFNWETLAHTQFTETQDGSPRTFTVDRDR